MKGASEQQSERVEFIPPKEFTPPEGKAEFELVCTFKVEGSKLCLTKLGDTPMPSESDGKPSYKHQAPPDMSDYANSLAAEPTGET